MSVTQEPTQVTGNGAQAYGDYYADDERGYGWVVFAGVLLLMLGTLNSSRVLRRSATRTSSPPTRTTSPAASIPGAGSCCASACSSGRGLRRVRQEPVLALGWRGGSRRQRDRAADDDPGVPILVSVDLHARHPRDLWPDRVRQADRRKLIDRLPCTSSMRGAMFFGSKKWHNRADGVSHPSDASRNEAEKLKSRQWHAWRRPDCDARLARVAGRSTPPNARPPSLSARWRRVQHAGNRIAPAVRGEASRFGHARGG